MAEILLRSIKRNVDEEEEEEGIQQQQPRPQHVEPPKKLTKKMGGKIRKYDYLKTVKSMDELDKFRFKKYCHFIAGKPLQILNSLTMPCTTRRSRKGCHFELRAVPSAELQSGDIHVYAHSHHNHPLWSEKKRLHYSKNFEPSSKKCQQKVSQQKQMEDDAEEEDAEEENDENEDIGEEEQTEQPPSKITKYVMGKKRMYNYVKTVESMDELDKFRFKNNCSFVSGKPFHIHGTRNIPCTRKKYGRGCKFELRAVRPSLDSDTIHVYAHSKHNHPFNESEEKRLKRKRGQELLRHQNLPTIFQMEDNIDKEEWGGEEEDEKEEDEEEEKGNDDDGEKNVEAVEQPQKQKIPTKITTKFGGQIKKYDYVKTVESMDELDKFRFKNNCMFMSGKPLHIYGTKTIRCSRKNKGKGCDFELRAWRPSLKSDTIHVYAHSRHNHPIQSEENRLIRKREKTLMPHRNPPSIFRTEDNIEWAFLKTFTNYDRMQQFRLKNQCKPKGGDLNKRWRIRFACSYSCTRNCKFALLAIKTTKRGFHLFRHGEHKNHPNVQQRNVQELADSHQNMDQQEGMEEDEDDEESEEEEEQEEEMDEEELKEENNNDEEEEDEEEEEPQQQPTDKTSIEGHVDDDDDDITFTEDEEQQKEELQEEGEGSMEIEFVVENPSENVQQTGRLEPIEIHEFYNVGTWLRRKR